LIPSHSASFLLLVRVSKYFVRKAPPHETPSWVGDGEVFFITFCAVERTNTPLTQNKVPGHLLDAAKHYHHLGRWWVRLFLIMPDHVHGLVSVPATEALRKVVAQWKSYTAKKTGMRWQMDYFDHRIRNLPALQEKELYILNNPVRRKLVEKIEDWPWILRQQDLMIAPGRKERSRS